MLGRGRKPGGRRRERTTMMPKVTWILGDGRQITAEVPIGRNLMEAAVANNVPDVIGECGGCLSCATCHVYVDPDWFAKTGGPGEMESEMLEFTLVEKRENSRLSCQIESSPVLEGLVLRVPQL
jgi:2Fe-2S ferredoxin